MQLVNCCNTLFHLHKKIYYLRICIMVLLICRSAVIAFASDMSDATTLRKKCEYQSKKLEIVVMNFGDKADKSDFDNATRMLKIAKIKMAQSNYIDAKKLYGDYLKLEYKIYGSLADKYTDRTQKIVDEVAVELVDFIDNKKVNKYLKMASQHLKTAKTTLTRKHYKLVIEDCRRSKEYILACYKVVNKPVPAKYLVDQADNEKKIFK